MPRSKGTFPKYKKVDIDSEIWPPKYWDSSKLCPACETRWPNMPVFAKTPCCGVAGTTDEHSAPDMRWPDAVSAYHAARFEDLYDNYNEGRTDQELAYEDGKEEIKKQKDFDFDQVESEIDSLTH